MTINGTQDPTSITAAQAKLEKDGFCIIPNVLNQLENEAALQHLWAAVDESKRHGETTFKDFIDPNDANVRVFYLMNLDPLFRSFNHHPTAISLVKSVFGENFLISNFTANIARPGSKSMGLHSDQSLMWPDPWLTPWNLNVIWCLTDIYFENGATLYIPGSHFWTSKEDVPSETEKLLVPFEAKAGSIVVMDGRMWHTSGANVTEDIDRVLLFGSYNVPWKRGQVNWAQGLTREIQETSSDELKEWLGVNRDGNLRIVKGMNRVF